MPLGKFKRGRVNEATRTVYEQELWVHTLAATTVKQATGDPSAVELAQSHVRDDGTPLPNGVLRLILSGNNQTEEPPFRSYDAVVNCIYDAVAFERQRAHETAQAFQALEAAPAQAQNV